MGLYGPEATHAEHRRRDLTSSYPRGRMTPLFQARGLLCRNSIGTVHKAKFLLNWVYLLRATCKGPKPFRLPRLRTRTRNNWSHQSMYHRPPIFVIMSSKTLHDLERFPQKKKKKAHEREEKTGHGCLMCPAPHSSSKRPRWLNILTFASTCLSTQAGLLQKSYSLFYGIANEDWACEHHLRRVWRLRLWLDNVGPTDRGWL